MTLRVGALFAGYGGLELALADVWDTELAWYAEFDGLPTAKRPHPVGASAVMAHHWPGVPNLGDVTTVGWDALPDVDVITGGSPCQDLSHAGKRGGMTEGTRSNLWVAMREAIARKEPDYVVWENVRGAYSAEADSAVEPCPGCLGDGSGPPLRALGRVLGDLSDLRYDVRWHGLRAADVGAAHARFRVFALGVKRGVSLPSVKPSRLLLGLEPQALPLVPTPSGFSAQRGLGAREDYHVNINEWAGHYDAGSLDLLPSPDAYAGSRGGSQHPDKRRAGGHSVSLADTAEHSLLPTPNVLDKDFGGNVSPERTDARAATGRQHMLSHEIGALLPTPKATNNENRPSEGYAGGVGWVLNDESLLPTPVVNDMGEGKSPEAWDEWTAEQKARHGNGNGHGASLAIEAQMLPTPRAQDGAGKSSHGRTYSSTDYNLHNVAKDAAWGPYAAAIARWAGVMRAESPEPTQPAQRPGKDGQPRRQLSAVFVEWLMGLAPGWVTDVEHVSRTQALHILGNGVVPHQAAHALRVLATLPLELTQPQTSTGAGPLSAARADLAQPLRPAPVEHDERTSA